MEKKETEIEKKNDAASKFENDPKRNEETKRARGKNDEEGGKGKRKVTRSASISLLLIGRSALASWPLIGHRSTAPKWQNKTLVFIFSSSVAFFSIDIAPYNPRKKKTKQQSKRRGNANRATPLVERGRVGLGKGNDQVGGWDGRQVVGGVRRWEKRRRRSSSSRRRRRRRRRKGGKGRGGGGGGGGVERPQ